MPLGAAALAGTSYPIDRAYTAQLLGFEAPAENSLDAVSDRDFAIEFTAAAALLMTHMSRFSEELILWSSTQFGFVAHCLILFSVNGQSNLNLGHNHVFTIHGRC